MIHTIDFNGQKLQCSEDETIMDALERSKVRYDVECRSGYCGTCRCRLIEGTVDYDSHPIARFSDNDLLICIAKPTSNVVVESY
ncbi:2Fe-2S iron-sulfur cluster-binding protein [Vibrio barjaei]|uniref:2Fe-2S iron-sulfur cluster-binding protein n=1 Tax=Vibrio barjaei TaxID=1676683 RepID=UPI002284EEBF|nr:2Fe-2S iron-sulfur cluster-binding protein [Vibrio barjaei]MCY9873815.1 2Fe-2S iron-sulfur cluster-binding protein [Vibrio barjaei]